MVGGPGQSGRVDGGGFDPGRPAIGPPRPAIDDVAVPEIGSIAGPSTGVGVTGAPTAPIHPRIGIDQDPSRPFIRDRRPTVIRRILIRRGDRNQAGASDRAPGPRSGGAVGIRVSPPVGRFRRYGEGPLARKRARSRSGCDPTRITSTAASPGRVEPPGHPEVGESPSNRTGGPRATSLSIPALDPRTSDGRSSGDLPGGDAPAEVARPAVGCQTPSPGDGGAEPGSATGGGPKPASARATR